MRNDRGPWFPEFVLEELRIVGQDWPPILVSKFETNDFGERRYVASKTYMPPNADRPLILDEPQDVSRT